VRKTGGLFLGFPEEQDAPVAPKTRTKLGGHLVLPLRLLECHHLDARCARERYNRLHERTCQHPAGIAANVRTDRAVFYVPEAVRSSLLPPSSNARLVGHALIEGARRRAKKAVVTNVSAAG
jgi:hypothetical protein